MNQTYREINLQYAVHPSLPSWGDLEGWLDEGNDNGHVGFIADIIRDNDGNVTQYTMLHSEASWTNSRGQSGGGTINEAVIKVGSEKGYAKSNYNHRFYQWDTPDDASNDSGTSTYDMPLPEYKPAYFNARQPTFREKVQDIFSSLGEALGL